MKIDSVKQLLLYKIEELSQSYSYDFLYEYEGEEQSERIVGQIVKRDNEGNVIGTLLSFRLFIKEEKGEGEFIFYHDKGELDKLSFYILKQETIIAIFEFIDKRLQVNSNRR